MEAVGFIVVMAAIAMLLRWVIIHDKAPNTATSGPFAMREPEPGDPAKLARGPIQAAGGKKPPLGPPAGPVRRPPFKPPDRAKR